MKLISFAGIGGALYQASRRAVLVAIFLGIVGACDRPPSSDIGDKDLDLLLTEGSAGVDTVAQHLITRQRALFQILLGDDRTNLADYLEIDFSWGVPPITIASNGVVIRRAGDVGSVGYFGFLGGFTPSQLDQMPTEYEAWLVSDDHATVLAGPVAERAYITTTWQRISRGWHATRMMAVPAEYVSQFRRLAKSR